MPEESPHTASRQLRVILAHADRRPASLTALSYSTTALLTLAAILILAATTGKVPESIMAVATVVALLGAAVSIQAARTISRIELTHAYVARQNSPELLPYTRLMISFWNLDAPPESLDLVYWQELTQAEQSEAVRTWNQTDKEERINKKWAQWEAMERNEKLELVVFMNFMEELAGVYNLRLLDRESVKKHVEYLARAYYEMGEWWIDRFRNKYNEPGTYVEWDAMNRRLLPDDQVTALARVDRIWRSVRRALGFK